MTETQWRECDDPGAMLELLRGKASERKLRLFAVACSRRFWNELKEERSRKTLETCESYVDGFATKGELIEARGAMAPFVFEMEAETEEELLQLGYRGGMPGSCDPDEMALGTAFEHPWIAAYDSSFAVIGWKEEERLGQCQILRDIFGPLPFRPVTVEGSWRTPTVLTLAKAAYHERQLPEGTLDHTHLAFLADALEAAGCTDADILGHLRSPGPHVRGCWALDLVLDKV